jgi:hypothetical protein
MATHSRILFNDILCLQISLSPFGLRAIKKQKLEESANREKVSVDKERFLESLLVLHWFCCINCFLVPVSESSPEKFHTTKVAFCVMGYNYL